MGPSSRDAARQRAGSNPSELVAEQLRKAGADPSKPHQTSHFLYVPGVKAAQQVARSLERPGRRVEIETSARKGYWMVAVIQPVVVTPDTIDALRSEFEAALAPLGGSYAYWQVAVDNG
jgi:hypothetical protein